MGDNGEMWNFRRRATKGAEPAAPADAGPLAVDLASLAAEMNVMLPELAAVRPSAVRRFDDRLRGRQWTEPSGLTGWFRVQPSDVQLLVQRCDDSRMAAALLSMHPNGFVREEAIKALASIDTGRALPYLVVRAADWVPQVRDRAAELATRVSSSRDQPN